MRSLGMQKTTAIVFKPNTLENTRFLEIGMFEKPLSRGHGSLELVRYRAVTARERSFNHRLSQQRLELVYRAPKFE